MMRGAGGGRESQQLLPAMDRHQAAGRVLMRRGDEDQPRPVAPALECETAAIEPDTAKLGAGGFEGCARAAIGDPVYR